MIDGIEFRDAAEALNKNVSVLYYMQGEVQESCVADAFDRTRKGLRCWQFSRKIILPAAKYFCYTCGRETKTPKLVKEICPRKSFNVGIYCPHYSGLGLGLNQNQRSPEKWRRA